MPWLSSPVVDLLPLSLHSTAPATEATPFNKTREHVRAILRNAGAYNQLYWTRKSD
jgi:hypothetical protein